MDNQQGKTEDLDLAWLAGFFDGEGHIGFQVLRGKRLREGGYAYYTPRFRLANTDQPTLTVVTDILDANRLPYHVTHRPAYGRNAASWDIAVAGMKRCKHWLDVLTPYLRTKQHKAHLMMEFIKLREHHTYGDDYTAQEMALIVQLRKAPPIPHRLHAETA